MSTYNEMMYCAQCDKHTMHLREKTNHILHLILSLLTFGVWLIVWALVSWSNSMQSQCTTCGRTLNWTRDKPLRKRQHAKVEPEPKTLEQLLQEK